MSAVQSSSLSFGLSKSLFQFCHSLVSEMLWGVLSLSLSTARRLIVQIWRTLNIWVSPPGRSFADNTGGNSDLSDNINTTAASCWKSDQDCLTISSVFKMYPMAVICLFWVGDSVCVAHRFWLPCHISKKLWTLPILSNFLTSAASSFSESFWVFVVSNAGSSPVNLQLLAQVNCLTTTFSQRISRVVVDCLQLRTSYPREKLDSTPTLCGMTENLSHGTLERSAYFECVSSSLRY